MAWFYNGRKYWYHNGKRYSRKVYKKNRKNFNKYIHTLDKNTNINNLYKEISISNKKFNDWCNYLNDEANYFNM